MSNVRSHSLQSGFTLVEILVAIPVLAIILVVAANILSTASTLTTVTNKHMDANGQARMVFDRMADDFARMVRRRDVDYIFWKAGTNTTAANDAMYFYTEGASYFDTSTFNSIPSPGATNSSEKNDVSLVGYRVNNNGGTVPASAAADPDYYQLERLGKALSIDGGAWNSSASNNSVQPNVMVFLTYPPAGFDVKGSVTPTWATGATGTKYKDPTLLSPAYSNAYFLSTLAGAYSNNGAASYGNLPSAVGSWPGSGVTSVFNDSKDTSYHSVGNRVFRFEYAFQLRDGTMSSIPVMTPNASTNALPTSFLSATQRPLPTDDSANTNGKGTFAIGSRWYDTTNQIGYICLDATPNAAVWQEVGIQDIAAIVVSIAVIDKQGLLYVQNSGIDMATVASQLPDYNAATTATVTGTVAGDPGYLLMPIVTTSWAYALTPTSAGGNSPMATATGIPQTMVSQIRVYQRCFYLNSF